MDAEATGGLIDLDRASLVRVEPDRWMCYKCHGMEHVEPSSRKPGAYHEEAHDT